MSAYHLRTPTSSWFITQVTGRLQKTLQFPVLALWLKPGRVTAGTWWFSCTTKFMSFCMIGIPTGVWSQTTPLATSMSEPVFTTKKQTSLWPFLSKGLESSWSTGTISQSYIITISSMGGKYTEATPKSPWPFFRPYKKLHGILTSTHSVLQISFITFLSKLVFIVIIFVASVIPQQLANNASQITLWSMENVNNVRPGQFTM